MKNVLFAAGIFTFTFASAQQNETFDIQGHILKRIRRSKETNPPDIISEKNIDSSAR